MISLKVFLICLLEFILGFAKFQRRFFAGNRKYNRARAARKNAPNRRAVRAVDGISLHLQSESDFWKAL
jgi:Na+-transporting methylmalonyl-CoA/oxaloacetate decarboxylase gamma subunit